MLNMLRMRRPMLFALCLAVCVLPLTATRASAQGPSSTPDVSPTPSASPSPEALELEQQRCADFTSQTDAQTFFESQGGPAQDPNGLDADRDGVACEGIVEVGVLAAAAAQDVAMCSDFSTREEAQSFLDDQQPGAAGDQNRQNLDPDGDGNACPNLPSSGSLDTGGQTAATPSPGTSATVSPTTTATASPTSTGLPKSGGPIQTFATIGISLTLIGWALMRMSRQRRPRPGPGPRKGAEPAAIAPVDVALWASLSAPASKKDDYSLLGG